jgi:low temperature requirement protein LtrA
MTDHEPVTGNIITVGILGMLVAIGLWWIYFDLVSLRTPRVKVQFVWVYLHFPLVVGVAAAGAAVLATIEHIGQPLSDTVRWLLTGSTSLALVAIVAIAATLVAQPENRQIHLTAGVTTLISAGLIALGGFTSLEAQGILIVTGFLLLFPVAISIVVWAKATNPVPAQPPR